MILLLFEIGLILFLYGSLKKEWKNISPIEDSFRERALATTIVLTQVSLVVFASSFFLSSFSFGAMVWASIAIISAIYTVGVAASRVNSKNVLREKPVAYMAAFSLLFLFFAVVRHLVGLL